LRIYLDNAATSWPKPNAVYEAVDRYQRELGASAGRGAYKAAQDAQRIVSETRSACARLLGISDSRQLVFTSGGTASLNLAIHGLLNPGDHVVASVSEHNSVLRPLSHQVSHNGVIVDYLGCDAAGYVDPAALKRLIQPTTRLVVVSHASNVTGALQPVAEIARVAHDVGAYVLLDAAQTAGCIPIDVEKLDIDLLACGGHKGLLGPLGIGLLYMRPGLEEQLRTNCQGGTGTDSLASDQPNRLPEKFEAGSLSLPAIAGLGAAMQYLEQQSVAAICQHHCELTTMLIDGLSAIAGINVFGPAANQPRVGVVSCSVEGYDPQEFAAAIELVGEVECRAGLHCAPLMHSALKTDVHGGLVRISPGFSTTLDDIESTLAAIGALAENSPA